MKFRIKKWILPGTLVLATITMVGCSKLPKKNRMQGCETTGPGGYVLDIAQSVHGSHRHIFYAAMDTIDTDPEGEWMGSGLVYRRIYRDEREVAFQELAINGRDDLPFRPIGISHVIEGKQHLVHIINRMVRNLTVVEEYIVEGKSLQFQSRYRSAKFKGSRRIVSLGSGHFYTLRQDPEKKAFLRTDHWKIQVLGFHRGVISVLPLDYGRAVDFMVLEAQRTGLGEKASDHEGEAIGENESFAGFRAVVANTEKISFVRTQAGENGYTARQKAPGFYGKNGPGSSAKITAIAPIAPKVGIRGKSDRQTVFMAMSSFQGNPLDLRELKEAARDPSLEMSLVSINVDSGESQVYARGWNKDGMIPSDMMMLGDRVYLSAYNRKGVLSCRLETIKN